jgi:hypothetical protein
MPREDRPAGETGGPLAQYYEHGQSSMVSWGIGEAPVVEPGVIPWPGAAGVRRAARPVPVGLGQSPGGGVGTGLPLSSGEPVRRGTWLRTAG